MLATLAEYERELITERVNAGIAAAKQNGTQFDRPPVDPDEIAEKPAIAENGRAKGRTAQGRNPSRRLVTSNLVPPPLRHLQSRNLDRAGVILATGAVTHCILMAKSPAIAQHAGTGRSRYQ
ncbi:hypothetical protein GCM10009689_17920 [Brevibacterium antiquum]